MHKHKIFNSMQILLGCKLNACEERIDFLSVCVLSISMPFREGLLWLQNLISQWSNVPEKRTKLLGMHVAPLSSFCSSYFLEHKPVLAVNMKWHELPMLGTCYEQLQGPMAPSVMQSLLGRHRIKTVEHYSNFKIWSVVSIVLLSN